MNNNEFMRAYRATKNDIKNNKAKACTHEACISHDTNDMLKHGAFARDKAQRDALCVWCRRCESRYNALYNRALRECNVRTRREINDITDEDARNAMHAKFDEIMSSMNVRSRRYTRRNV
jgi:hypothetical protein